MNRHSPTIHPRYAPAFGVGLLFLLAAGCGASPSDAPLEDPGAGDPLCEMPAILSDTVLVADVVVLSYDDGVARPGYSVLVADGRILEVGATGTVTAPLHATTLPGCGRFLVPGLADMHVHMSRADVGAYVRSGVTTVRNLWGFPDLLAMQAEVTAGTLDGPNIYAISSGLDGTPAKWPLTQFVIDPVDADPVVAGQAALGYQTLKLYQDLTMPAFDAIVQSANTRGLDFGGHVPHRVGLIHSLDSGYRFIEHLSGYETLLNGTGQRGAFGWRTIDSSVIPALVSATVEAGTWNSPTLAIFTLFAAGDASITRNRQLMVKALFDAGAPLLIGTDSGIDVTAPGISLHDEIAEFIAAGLTPLEALRVATLEAARFLGEEQEFGRIAPGMRADFLLVSTNPIAQVGVLRTPLAVFVRGRRVH